MIPLITEIIQKFGPRPAGSEAEKKAQLFIAEKCKLLTNKVKLQDFDEYLHARFGKLKYYCALFFISMLLFYFEQPKLALGLSLFNALAFILDFMTYTAILPSFPGKLSKSWNVEATLEPQGEVKKTLILSGHIDSVYEFKWWYKLGQMGSYLTIIAGLIMVLFPVFCLLTLVTTASDWQFWFFVLFLVLSPSTVAYFNMHGELPVDGACDNLSGIAITYTVFESFCKQGEMGKNTLQHTRLKFVSFGSEETGLSGSMNYVKAYKNELKLENAHLVNIDSIRVPEEISIVKTELMSGTKHSKLLINLLQKSFSSKNIPLKTGTIPIGGTDAVPFARAGLPSVSIIGLAMDKLDPTYHTRRDTVENLSDIALDNCKNGLIEFVKQFDTVV